MIVRRQSLNQSGWIQKQLLEDRIGKRLVSGGDMEISMRTGRVAELWYNPACTLSHIIPAERMTKEYVRRMVFGLGASRHNVAALNWSGSYVSWLLYSIVYGAGFTLFGGFEFVRELINSAGAADLKMSVSPGCGWWMALWTMLRMEPVQRRSILGGVKRVDTHPETVSQLSLSSS